MADQQERVTLTPGMIFRMPNYGLVRFERWDNCCGQISAEITLLERGNERHNPLPDEVYAALKSSPSSPSEPSRGEMTDDEAIYHIPRAALSEFNEKFCNRDSALMACAEAAFFACTRALLQSSPNAASTGTERETLRNLDRYMANCGYGSDHPWRSEIAASLSSPQEASKPQEWEPMGKYAQKLVASQPSASSGRERELTIIGLQALARHVRACDAYKNLRGDMDIVDDAIAALTGAAPADANVGGLSDAEIVKALHSLGVDTYPSQYGFTELQVSATSVPTIRKLLEIFLAASTPTAPEPSAPADKVDAERFRHLLENANIGFDENEDVQLVIVHPPTGTEWKQWVRAAIDRMRSESGKGGKL